MLSYWIETHRQAHMRNVTENARITGVTIVSVMSDKYYDAVTVRVFATGLDYMLTVRFAQWRHRRRRPPPRRGRFARNSASPGETFQRYSLQPMLKKLRMRGYRSLRGILTRIGLDVRPAARARTWRKRCGTSSRVDTGPGR